MPIRIPGRRGLMAVTKPEAEQLIQTGGHRLPVDDGSAPAGGLAPQVAGGESCDEFNHTWGDIVRRDGPCNCGRLIAHWDDCGQEGQERLVGRWAGEIQGELEPERAPLWTWIVVAAFVILGLYSLYDISQGPLFR